MLILYVAAEMFPLLKTGGLADVIGALPAAQIAEGIDTRVLLDICRGVVDTWGIARRDTLAGSITLLYGNVGVVGIYLIDAPHLYDRPRGLADTVTDCSLENLADGLATGFVFMRRDARALARAIRRVFVLWSKPSLWRYVQRQAMGMDFSWHITAKAYGQLYQGML
ncbi:glycogen synthase [Escherichia coli]|nr:glycogen synthase [Escherichia coli]CAD6086455.1 glycogen synthase [Escherichia coli]CAD6149484.1 glycogen synthase [Escherichia coli]